MTYLNTHIPRSLTISKKKKKLSNSFTISYNIQPKHDQMITFSLTASSLFEICCCFWDILGLGSTSLTSCCFHSNWDVIMSTINRKTSSIGLDIITNYFHTTCQQIPQTKRNTYYHQKLDHPNKNHNRTHLHYKLANIMQ